MKLQQMISILLINLAAVDGAVDIDSFEQLVRTLHSCYHVS